MNNYLLLVDTYESETIDEAALKTNNVSGMIIRLNHIEGGHHLDANFTTQWSETGKAGLLRIPYFVYNPWVNGQKNYDWLVKHMPYEAGAVMVDIEVIYYGYSPATYAAEVAKFFQLMGPRWNYMIYTGEGFLHLLSSWPKDADYWWAQYPNSLYPPTSQKWTWDQVRAKVDTLDGPYNAAKIPGRLKMWQASGDRLILPGSAKPIDVNVFPGTYEELKTWVNEKLVLPDPDPIDEHTKPYVGVELHKVYRFNSHCYVAVIDPNGKRFLVTKFGQKNVSTVAREMGAQIVINGGDYSSYHATGLHASQGRIYQVVIPYEPWVNLTADNKPQINAYNSREKKYNALAGKRFIVLNGKISPSTSAAWREVHPRTLVGVTQDGKFIECVVDGRQGPKNIGVDLFDAARIMIEFGAWKAIDLDGGGSSAIWVGDKIVNTPIDNGVTGQERYVGTHIATFVDGIVPPPPPTGGYIVVTPIKPRLTPSMYQIITKPNLPVGTGFNSTTTQVVTETIPPFWGTKYTITWVQMPDGYWVPKFYKKEYVKDNTH
ncbi:MAG: phosphodiester glycosidase family protein [Anaerolineales bacterium]|nr:phosphodiester glycosidase family protein [Anaerolineales bacterium]